jgi:hypothetical protein
MALEVDYLVIGGGGGGGHQQAGGGGAGGYLAGTNFAVSEQAYTITVGAGGSPGTVSAKGGNGGNSIFATITAIGGGGGATFNIDSSLGAGGGSGGGTALNGTTAATGTSGQGNNGGTSVSGRGAGGGGAGAVGANAPTGNNGGGNGGAGLASSITGTSVFRAGGGGGGAFNTDSNPAGTGGVGGGGNGSKNSVGSDGTPNTGGGGGGGGQTAGGFNGGSGGSGIVIIRYLTANFGSCTGGTITTDGSYTIHTFTSSGTFTVVAPVAPTTLTAKAIPVNSAKVASTQTNFPVYIKPSAMTGWGSLTTAEANSIRFYSDSALTTELAREVVTTDEIHVKVPSLTTTTTIYATYDGVRADYAPTDTYGRNAVWSDYAAVYHMQGNYNSATGSNDGTFQAGATYGTSFAAIGGADSQGVDMRGSNGDEIRTAMTFSDGTPNTTQAWARYDGTPPSNNRNIWTYWNTSISPVAARQFAGTNSSTTMRFGDDFNGSYTFGADTWRHVVLTIAASGEKQAYLQGVNILSKTTSLTAPKYTALHIGSQKSANENWNGKIDEVRVRASVLSANWITTEYNNQSDVATFWGTVTDVGGASNQGFALWYA